jgi:hypothetical protein
MKIINQFYEVTTGYGRGYDTVLQTEDPTEALAGCRAAMERASSLTEGFFKKRPMLYQWVKLELVGKRRIRLKLASWQQEGKDGQWWVGPDLDSLASTWPEPEPEPDLEVASKIGPANA